MGAFGGVGRGLVSLCLVLCVFMMFLCVVMGASGGVGMVLSFYAWCYARTMDGKTDSLAQFSRTFCFSPFRHTSFERKGGLKHASLSSDTA